MKLRYRRLVNYLITPVKKKRGSFFKFLGGTRPEELVVEFESILRKEGFQRRALEAAYKFGVPYKDRHEFIKSVAEVLIFKRIFNISSQKVEFAARELLNPGRDTIINFPGPLSE